MGSDGQGGATLHALVDALPYPFFGKDASLRYTECNQAFCQYLGLTREAIIGKTVFDLSPPDKAREYDTADRELLARGGEKRYESTVRDRHGAERTVIFHKAVLAAPDGSVAGIVGSIVDINDLRVAEDARRQASEALKILNLELEQRVLDRANQLAHANEALGTLRRAIENSPTAVVITNRQGTIEYVNPRFSEVTGFSAEECLGRTPRVLKSGIHGPEFYRQLWKALTEGQVWRGELCNRKRNGDLYWEHASIAPVKNAQGDITHFVAVKEDITERRRIEQSLRDSERRAKMAMDLALLVHWELDVANRMYTFDEQFYALYGTSADREGGTHMSVAEYTRRFLPPDEQPLVEREIRQSLAQEDSGQVRRLEHRILRVDGEERFVAVRYQIQRNAQGEVVALRGANQDITERKRVERQLVEAKARTDAANQELELSLERQRELEKLKEQLVGLLVHDLKSPLGAVLVNASYLESGDSDEAERGEILAEVIAATQAMHRMVMDMLDVMRVDERGLVPNRRAVDIGSLLHEAARPALAQARTSGPRIQVATPSPSIEASVDPDLLRRVLENLLDNAVKYAPTSTSVIVRAGWLGSLLKLEVLDDGPGIPEHEQERIFEPYARLSRDSENKARQSRGLGLAFCRLAVEAHGGRILVRNRVPRGAAFVVELPVV